MVFWNGFFNRMPYTNLQSINLDWMLKKLTEIPDLIKTEVNRLSQELRDTINDKLSRDGSDQMTGVLDMGGNRISDVGVPQYPGDAVTKAYTDSAYAPTGYGLGIESPPIRVGNLDALNGATKNGWLRIGTPSESPITLGGMNYTDGWGNNSSYNTNYGVQDIYPLTNKHYHIKRWRYGDVWVDEWANPPLVPGIEYQTLERSNGLPVYVKRVSYTISAPIGNASGVALVNIPHNIGGVAKIVKCVGRYTTSNYQLPYLSSAGGITVVNGANAAVITIRVKDMTWNDGTFEFDIYYTK